MKLAVNVATDKADHPLILTHIGTDNRIRMYTFKLQSVLDHRQLLEDNIKKELAEIRQRAIENQQQLELLRRKEMDTIRALKQEQTEGLSSDQVVAYHAFLRDLAQRMAKQQKVIEEIHTQETAKKDELLEAMKKRQILEKLKDQGLDQYHQSILKKERVFIDEIAVNQFVRSTLSRNGDEE
jgi:flagellar FliJ protein